MAILKIRDAEGKVYEIPVLKGNNYVLTDADKQEIVDMTKAQIVIPDFSAFQTEEQVLALIQANMPTSAEEVDY